MGGRERHQAWLAWLAQPVMSGVSQEVSLGNSVSQHHGPSVPKVPSLGAMWAHYDDTTICLHLVFFYLLILPLGPCPLPSGLHPLEPLDLLFSRFCRSLRAEVGGVCMSLAVPHSDCIMTSCPLSQHGSSSTIPRPCSCHHGVCLACWNMYQALWRGLYKL